MCFFSKAPKQKQKGEKEKRSFDFVTACNLKNDCLSSEIMETNQSKENREKEVFKKVPKARALLYEQYFKEIERLSNTSTSTLQQSGSSSCSRTAGRTQTFASNVLPLSSSAKPNDESSSELDPKRKGKRTRAARKIKKLKKEAATIEKQLKKLKKKQSTTRKCLRRSKKRLKKLFLKEHRLNLEYANLEEIENCIIYPL